MWNSSRRYTTGKYFNIDQRYGEEKPPIDEEDAVKINKMFIEFEHWCTAYSFRENNNGSNKLLIETRKNTIMNNIIWEKKEMEEL